MSRDDDKPDMAQAVSEPAAACRLEELRSECEMLREESRHCREAENKYRMMIENAYEGVCVICDARIVFANGRMAEILECSRTELYEREIWDFTHPDEMEEVRERYASRLRGTAAPASYRSRVKTCSGAVKWVSITPSRIEWDGAPAILTYFADVSEYAAVEDDLRRAHREIELIVRSLSSILISVGSDGRVDQWNRSAAEVFGIPEREAAGKMFATCRIAWDWVRISQAVEESRVTGAAVRVDEMPFRRPDGSSGSLGLTISPMNVDGGDFSGFVLIGSDISEIKAAELRVSQEQKMQSIGRLAAGIAHEINTPTQYVGDNIRFLRDAFGDMFSLLGLYGRLSGVPGGDNGREGLLAEIREATDAADLEYLRDQVPKAIAESLEGIARVTKIVLSMKQFSHPGVEEKIMADLNKAVENTVTISRNEWKYVADLILDLDPRLPLVKCLLSEINQVLLNVILNAAQAISEAVGGESGRKGMIVIKTLAEGGFVEIRVSDTGPGIPESVRANIFDPFFTTKDVGKGTGQGLAIAHAVIVEKHGGSIAFETELGAGTTFIIRLPVGHEG